MGTLEVCSRAGQSSYCLALLDDLVLWCSGRPVGVSDKSLSFDIKHSKCLVLACCFHRVTLDIASPSIHLTDRLLVRSSIPLSFTQRLYTPEIAHHILRLSKVDFL